MISDARKAELDRGPPDTVRVFVRDAGELEPGGPLAELVVSQDGRQIAVLGLTGHEIDFWILKLSAARCAGNKRPNGDRR